MMKAIRPPDNWQDFEKLCKKLFGEIWGCSMTIKQNGRLGQSQSGVDIYAKPKGETEYWGIQCKGKDNYTDSKLTEKEIDEEIQKALTFNPKLNTFIFATTALKDAKTEEIIRLRDIESCEKGSFSIILYCWQDLTDFINENKDTFNWYVNEIQFKDKYDVEVSFFSKNDDHILTPTFLRTTNFYVLHSELTKAMKSLSWKNKLYTPYPTVPPFFGSNEVNKSWSSFTTVVRNTGSMVIEDWKLILEFSDDVKNIDDDFDSNPFNYKEVSKYRTTWADETNNSILYLPLNKSPLIQKDSTEFKSFCLPKFEAKEIKVYWRLLARDFNVEGEQTFTVEPIYEKRRKEHYVDNDEDVRIEEFISEYITSIENNEDDIDDDFIIN